ncbi:MAG: hypothetical protein ACREIA_00475 [Opitutaceae bacterium]
MASRPFLRLAPWLILLVCVYALGRWQGTRVARDADDEESAFTTEEPVEASPPAHEATPEATREPPEAPRAELLIAELEAVATAARSMSVPDANTYAFFEKLSLEDVGPVTGRIESMPPGNEQDVLFLMAIRRWAQLDGPAALDRAARFPALATRLNARLAAFEAWAAHDAPAAFTVALENTSPDSQARAISAVMTGAATSDPAQALKLLDGAPAEFLESPGAAAAQIVSGAYGTGKGEMLRELIAATPEGTVRSQMIETLAAEWGAHYPDEAFAWVQQVAAEGEGRETAVNSLFLSLVQKDPALAAVWGNDYPDDSRRTSYIAAAVQSWARMDTIAAETWVNEQPSGRYLDGASYAMAAHFMAEEDMTRSFSWIRRINTVEMRAELLGTLGRMWASEKPEDFKSFLDQTSLNRAEVEMLLAKIPPAS